MPIVVVPEVLREKLGDEGSKALVELLKSVQREAKEDAITLVEERFARRLAEELGKLRKEMYERFAAVFKEIGELRAELTEKIEQVKTELYAEINSLRSEMNDLRNEMDNLRSEVNGLRSEMNALRSEMSDLRSKMNDLRGEMNEKFAAVYMDMEKLRTEMHSMRADIIKWMFVFWISQLLTLVGIVIALVKLLG